MKAVKQQYFGTAGFALHEYDIREMKRQPFDLLRDEVRWKSFYAGLSALIARTDFRIIVATVDKIRMQEAYPNPFHPYQYSLHVIIERVINEKAFGETCRIVAENRQAGLNNELMTELLRLQFQGGSIDGQATVSADEVRARIDPTIVFRGKKTWTRALKSRTSALRR